MLAAVSEARHPKATPAAMREVQESIYREKILRARAMTSAERFASGLALTNDAIQRHLEGAMSLLGITDVQLGWQEARRRARRIAHARGHGFYTTTPRHP